MPYPLRAEDISFLDRSVVLARAEVVVESTRERVWQAVADAAAWPSWFVGMHSARYTSSGPPGVGSTRTVGVGPLTLEETVLVFDPGACFAFRVDSVNLPLFGALVEVITLEPSGVGTRVVYRQAMEPARFLRPFVPVLRMVMQHSLSRALGGLPDWCRRA